MKRNSKFTGLFLAVLVSWGTVLPVAASSRTAQDPAPESSSSAAEETGPTYLPYSPQEMASKLHGSWRGSYKTPQTQLSYISDGADLNFVNGSSQRLFLNVDSYGAEYILPNHWSIQDSTLSYSFNDGPWLAEVRLYFLDDSTLSGTYSQFGYTYDIQFDKVSSQPIDYDGQPQFVFENEPYETWLERLRQYPDFAQTEEQIPYSYELYRWDKSLFLVNSYGMYEAIYNAQTDVDKMIALLNVVCNNFQHIGSSGMPESWDPYSVVQYASANGGIECRGLSIILSEMLRLCGIPAKPILCIPSTEPCADCHCVVHAYSKELGQWIMLDPTYRLILQNEAGQYVSLPMLRDSLIQGTKLIANSNAGHNGMPFYMDFYRAYMTKNAFRFSNATKFYYGSDVKDQMKQSAVDGSPLPEVYDPNAGINPVYMLAPVNYAVPYAGSRSERVTTSAASFWAAPAL